MEVLIGSFMTGILVATLFVIFGLGSKAWRKTEAKSEALQRLQTMLSKITRQTERSRFSSVSLDPDDPAVPATAFCFASAIDAQGDYVYDPVDTALVWQKYSIVAWDETSQEVTWRDVALATPRPIVDTIDLVETTLGTFPLVDYRTPTDKVIGHGVTSFIVEQPRPQILSIECSAQRRREGSSEMESLTMKQVIEFRN